MNIPGVHIERIRALGYTESEARFLHIVAVFSGYFTLRQFRMFTGTRFGQRPTSFAQKLMHQGHARICGQERRASLFHLFSRSLYGQMDKENLRNRKRHSLAFMRTRVTLLDFVLANQNLAYFETEQEKANYFREELGISKEHLPATVYEGAAPNQKTIRYFVDKFPLFLAPPFPGVPPVVTFTYVDAGFETPFNFASHLSAYQPLFRQLSSFRFVYIAAKQGYVHGVGERFRYIVKRPVEADVADEIVRYFQIRQKWDNHEYIIPVTEDLEFLKDALERYRHEGRIERLYESWCRGELAESELRLEISKREQRAIFFDTYIFHRDRPSSTEDADQGYECRKDTVHCVRQGSRQFDADAKTLGT